MIPFDGRTVAFEQGLVGRSACGKAAAGGEKGLVRHVGGVTIAVAGAGIVGFGGTGGVADLFHNVEQVKAFGAFDIGRTEAFAFERFDLAGEVFDVVDHGGQCGAFGCEHAARRDEGNEIDDPLAATLARLKVSADFVVHRVK